MRLPPIRQYKTCYDKQSTPLTSFLQSYAIPKRMTCLHFSNPKAFRFLHVNLRKKVDNEQIRIYTCDGPLCIQRSAIKKMIPQHRTL